MKKVKLSLQPSEMCYNLKPVIVQWDKRKLSILNEKRILNAGIACNLRAAEKLHKDAALCVKLFTIINLSNNELESVPTILFQLPSLVELNISNNKIKLLPTTNGAEEEINSDENSTLTENWNCPSLQEFELHHNQVTFLPKEMFAMPSLHTVNCEWNNIDKLPFDMWIAPSLKILILSHNNLSDLPVFATGESIKPKQVVKNRKQK